MKKILFMLFCVVPLLCCGRQLRPLVWVIDAGHGGKDQGTSCRTALEKDINLQVAMELKELLRKHKPGIKVIMTREKDRFLTLEERCRIANKARADLFLSIHVNSAPNKMMYGTETFYANLCRSSNSVQSGTLSRNIEKSELLARLIQKNYGESGRPSTRGARCKKLYVCHNTAMPSVLTEIGFLSNIKDAAYMCSAEGRHEIAVNIFNALMEYYTTTQAKTHKTTLTTLRRTSDKKSGVKAFRIETGRGGAKGATSKAVPEEAGSEKFTEPRPEAAGDTIGLSPAGQDSTIPVYSIQIVSVGKELAVGDARLKGLAPITFVRDGNVFKGLYGGTTDYRQARKTLDTVRRKFPDAFIVAYVGEKFVPTAEALKMSPSGSAQSRPGRR